MIISKPTDVHGRSQTYCSSSLTRPFSAVARAPHLGRGYGGQYPPHRGVTKLFAAMTWKPVPTFFVAVSKWERFSAAFRNWVGTAGSSRPRGRAALGPKRTVAAICRRPVVMELWRLQFRQ